MNKGYFGEFGGQYVPEELLPYLNKIEQKYNELKDSDSFKSSLKSLLKEYVGRPSPLYFARNLSKDIGCRIYLKREDLNHTGAHKINNTLGQALLAKSMNKKEIIAETGAGQHGVATATAAALLGMKCKIFMGKADTIKQKLNVQRISLLGAEVITVERGSGILKDAVDEALGYLIENPEVYYLLGSVVGPHPYPTIVRDFQKIIGEEARIQIIEQEGRLPDYLVACVGGGSNAMGLFYDFIEDENVKLIAVEPAGKGLEPGNHAATLTLGSPGVIHGFRCYLLQDNEGNPADIHSIASGLDYPGVGPEPSMLKDSNRLILGSVTDVQAINAFNYLSRAEGIIPALETSHALAFILEHSSMFNKGDIIIVNLSGRGDKDVETVLQSSS